MFTLIWIWDYNHFSDFDIDFENCNLEISVMYNVQGQCEILKVKYVGRTIRTNGFTLGRHE